MSYAARISFACFWSLLPLLGFSACSGHESPGAAGSANNSVNGSAGTLGSVGMSGSGGFAGKGSVGNAGIVGAGGAFAQGGSAPTAGGGSASGGSANIGSAGVGANAGLGGNTSISAAGMGGARPSSGGSSGFGNVAGAAGSSAAFTQVSNILGKNCGIKGCHLDAESPRFVPGPMLYATLTGPNTVLAACDYTSLVEPGKPSDSALVRLMNRKCGSFTMPPTCRETTCLSAADLKTISDWISAGAPP